jgi:hypothetical protein
MRAYEEEGGKEVIACPPCFAARHAKSADNEMCDLLSDLKDRASPKRGATEKIGVTE